MAKLLAMVFGGVFVIVGALGWFPNPIIGSMAFFETNHVHDAVHLVFGLILLAVGVIVPRASSLWLKILGVVYLLLAVLGFLLIPDGGSLLGLVTTNMADHLLHVVLGVVLLVAGFACKDTVKTDVASMPVSAPAPAPVMPPSSPTDSTI